MALPSVRPNHGCMSMAQDSNLRPLRSDEAYSRDSAPVGGGRSNDPLAELARLIGQNDPFVDIRRQDPRGSAAPAGGQHLTPQTTPDWRARSPGAREGQRGGHDDPGYQGEARYQEPQYEGYQGAYAEHGSENQAYDYEANAYYDDQMPPQGQESYDEAPPAKRRGGLTTVAAVVALAILGTGGVYGYRAWIGPSGVAGEPPVIKAEQAPTKVVPAAPSSDNQLNKQIYDRVGDRGGEKVVPREEQPVDVRNAVRSTPPALGAVGSTGSVLPPLAAPAPSTAAAGSEPKKVKTVPIRPDQPAGAAASSQSTRSLAATQGAPVAPSPAPTRVATIPIQPSAARPAPATSEGGNYVQVSSQYKEADALASFKVLQGKYPDLLAGQRVTVQRVDLSDRGLGVRYRAMVGPFSSVDEAKQLCASLKSAGAQCVVPTN
jgi:SPOR domain